MEVVKFISELSSLFPTILLDSFTRSLAAILDALYLSKMCFIQE